MRGRRHRVDGAVQRRAPRREKVQWGKLSVHARCRRWCVGRRNRARAANITLVRLVLRTVQGEGEYDEAGNPREVIVREGDAGDVEVVRLVVDV